MCELKGSLAAHKKRGHLTISAGLVFFAILTTACGRLTPQSATEATPQPAESTPTTTHETTGSPQIQPGLPEDPKFTYITIDQGLSDQRVLSILQDSTGFMWFGTINGLNRFDGYNIVEYRNDPSNPNSLSSNSVEDLYEDRSGTLWVATRFGLNAFDRQTEQFTQYLHDPEDPHSLSSNTVISIHEDQSGDLWIGTLGGLNRFDRATGTFTTFQHDPADPESLSNNLVLVIHEDQSGVMWIGTHGGGLNRYDRITGSFTAYRHDPADPRSLSHDIIFDVYEDHSGTLWVATDGGGLNRFDRATGTFTAYRHDPDDPHSLANDQVDCIFEDASGALWVGTFGGGLSVFDLDRERITTIRRDSSNPASLSNETIADVSADRSGLIWIGTQGGGVNIYNPQQQVFTIYHQSPGVANSLASDNIWSVYEDQEGVVWVGTQDRGLERFDRQSGQVSHYPPDPENPQRLGHPLVTGIDQDSTGALWVGTFGGGLYRLDQANNKFSVFRHDSANPQSLSHDAIFDLFVDASGQLWVGTAGGLSLFDQKSSTFTSYRHDPDNPQSLSQDIIMKIAEDRHGSLWIATFSGGLNRMEPDTGQVMRYQHDPEDPASLGDDSLSSLLIDRSGVLWVSTAAKGLDRFDPEGGTFTHYREGDGLASDRIVTILEDGDEEDPAAGNIWIVTGRGLSKLDRDRNTFYTYDVSGGLPLTEFNRGGYKTRSGELLLSSTDGLIAFNPASLRDNEYVPPVVFTEFLLGQNPVQIGADSPLQQAINLTEVIELTHADKVISIGFSALSYSAPNQNRYRYRLEGLEEDWIEVDSTRRLVTYTNLDPGRYVFRVTGSNGDGVWNEVGREITLIITPPWWETWWFLGGMLLLIVGLVAGGFVWQRHSLSRRELHLEATVAERTHELDERVKELNCLYGISRLAGQQGISLNQILEGVVELLPPAMQYPEIACARIVLNGQEIETDNYRETPWQQSAAIAVRREKAGQVEVAYLEERPEADEGPFLQDERLLLIAVAERLGRITEQVQAEETLSYQATLLSNVSDAVIITDLDFTIQSWNSVAEAIYGWRAEEAIGKSMVQLIPVEYPHDEPEAVLTQFQAEGIWQGEVIQKLKDGSDIHILASVTKVRDNTGRPISVLAINRDISELKKAVEEATYEQGLMHTLLENTPDYIYFKDRDRNFVRVSNSFGDLFNCNLDEIIGKKDEDLFPPEVAEETSSEDRHVIETGTPLINKEEGTVVGGEEHWVLTTKLPWMDKDGNIIGLFGFSKEITERKEMEEQIEEIAATAERDRLARRLHDAVTQTLFSASVIAESTPRIMDNDPELGKRNLEQLAIMLRGSLAEMRTMLIELRPQELVGKSLDELMRTLVDGNQVRIGCPVNLVIDGEGTLPEEVTVVLYRIAQEAINNIIKYAEADEVGVNIAYNDGGIEMIVNDNGRGFEPAKISSGKFGLKIMAERMDQIEGELTIASKPGHGTQVKANWSEGANHE